jgi:hypothetical protein
VLGTRDDFDFNPANKTYYRAGQMDMLVEDAGFYRAAVLGESHNRTLLVVAGR